MMSNLRDQSLLKRGSAKDFAYFELKQRILKGELAPNQAIVEEELSDELEISRTPLRSALQQLVFENLVERKPNGRLKVPSVSVKELEEIFTIRGKLEEIAVEQATENSTQDDVRSLSNIAFMIKQTHKDGRVEDILYYGSQFHNYIYDLSDNQTIIYILSQLNDHIHRYRRLVPDQSIDRTIEAGEEHEVILDCIARKDKKGAKFAMQKHIYNSLQVAKSAVIPFEKNKFNK